MSNTTPHYLFLTTSTRESGHLGNTEWLAQQAAAALPAGTVIDYETSLLESKFVFRNPNVADACGCGESIRFKDADQAQA